MNNANGNQNSLLQNARNYLARFPDGRKALANTRNASEVIEAYQEKLLAVPVPDVEQNLRLSLSRGA